MKHRPWRVFAAIVGILAGGLVMHAYEQARSVHPPSGWSREMGTPLNEARGAPRVANSVWRLGDGAVFRSDSAVDQLFLRARVEPGSALEVSIDGQTTVRMTSDGFESIRRPEGASACMGTLSTVQDGEIPLELSRTEDGIVLQSGEKRAICADPGDDRPVVQAQGRVDLVSIGRDRRPDGVPLSPLEWLAGTMIVGFVWMLIIDGALVRQVSFPRLTIAWVPIGLGWVGLGGDGSPLTIAITAVGASLGLIGLLALIGPRGARTAEE